MAIISRIALLSCLSFVLPVLHGCKTTEDAASSVKFYGADNKSAYLEFETKVSIDLPPNLSANDLRSDRNQAAVKQIIDRQIQHMFGAFTEHPEFKEQPGIAFGNESIEITEIADGPGQTALVTYKFKDKVVFHKDRVGDTRSRLQFRLPANPLTIYKESLSPLAEAIALYETDGDEYDLEELQHLDERGARFVNLCTDLHYNSEGDFWYFWNPEKLGCNISSQQVINVNGTLNPIPSTTETYPEYNELYGDNGNGDLFHIVYLVGIDESFRRGDLGRQTFQDSIRLLRESGWRVVGDRLNQRSRKLERNVNGLKSRLDVMLVDPGQTDFVRQSKKALESADVFIYDGHSGLGGYLYVDRFQRSLGRALQLSSDKSQIYYFNGCSTYAYYNGDYFKLKATPGDVVGSKNLDIITTSIGALFSVGAKHDVSLINNLTSGDRPSWQKIMDDIYETAPDETALTHVNGDEDNPTSPR